jgi:Alpha amylase, catalytic domain
MPASAHALMEFHISRGARDRYRFDETLFSLTGNVLFANFRAARVFAHQMNAKRDLMRFPEQAVKASHISAMGLIDEVLHYVAQLYREQRNPAVMRQAMNWLGDRLGHDALDRALRRFVDEFPPVAVYTRKAGANTYLEGATAGAPHRELILEELLLLWLANANPAFAPFSELFDDAVLVRETAYGQVIAGLCEFFQTQPPFGPDDQSLVDMLRSPALAVPYSLSGQLAYILEKWGYLLGKYLSRLLSSLDLIREEERTVFLGPGPAQVYQFAEQRTESERFSPDRDWMPRVVLLAKNAYVWLDQLTKKYQRPVRRLDQIPDEELDMLARRGLTGLWLIGLWERGRASQTIKQLCGNPEAVASAYSVFEYRIASDLGGEAACRALRARAGRWGIRLACDMVPNHTGMDARWVIEHPDWFLGLDQSPFPSYSFSGPDLSGDSRVGLFLEDHYFTRTDAAVVFKRLDRLTGAERYIYHGNDGTGMPWNDTAQLDFLRPAVREAVLGTILQVAREFSIIRLDAAMALAKQHYQRLWFPEPGTGGAIPSRADHGLRKEQFDALMPQEFWREVVNLVAAELPDTLLLAEAFWLMEGYFVRTLGMHRVYNNAFMNMLKAEDNASYRSVMKNTLEFSPEILKRFVNFMNNPDEETAVAQFGKGDKYFGVCTLMVTLPGLPMFGHGQIEGFTEKYGMEYRRAYRDEVPDESLVQRHEHAIFPLLRRRDLFAGVENFVLYDFFAPEGTVNEDVFAYSNRSGSDRGLVLYHNKYASARGWIRTSVAQAVRTGAGDEPRLIQKDLAVGLGLCGEADCFCLFRDHTTGLEYIRNSRELCEKGLYAELGAYQCHVFLDFREVRDNDRHEYARLAACLNGRGVPNLEEALRGIRLEPVHRPFEGLVNAAVLRRVLAARVTQPGARVAGEVLGDLEQRGLHLFRAIKQFTGGVGDPDRLARETRRGVEVVLQLGLPANWAPAPAANLGLRLADWVPVGTAEGLFAWGTALGWALVHRLGKILGENDFQEYSRSWLDEWLLGRILAGALRDLGLDDAAAWQGVGVVKWLTSHQRWFETAAPMKVPVYQVLESLLRDVEVQRFLGVNRHQEVLWFNREAFDYLLRWLGLAAAVEVGTDTNRAATEVGQELARRCSVLDGLRRAARESGYQVEKLLTAAKEMSGPDQG